MPDSQGQTDSRFCPMCRELLPAEQYDRHMSQAHDLFVYQGVYRHLADTLATLRDDLRWPGLRPAAWPALLQVAQLQTGSTAGPRDALIARQLILSLRQTPVRQRGLHIAELVGVLQKGPPSVFLRLAASRSPTSRRLALAVLAALPPPHAQPVRQTLRRLVRDRDLPSSERLKAVVGLLLGLGDTAEARKLLSHYATRPSKRQTLQILDRLEKQTGPLAVLSWLRQQVESEQRLACPRCQVELRQPEMMSHLWQEHRLVLEGRRVRDPWNLVEEWLDLARDESQRFWIDRCRIAVVKIDPQQGLLRLNRLLLTRQLGDDRAKQEILSEALRQHAGCCPWCYALVPQPGRESIPAVLLRSDRLVAGDYALFLDETGLRPMLEVRSPAGLLFRGVEPGSTWTPGGARQLWSGTVVALALVCAVFWPRSLGPPIRPVVVLLFVAWLFWEAGRLVERREEPARERVLGHTWELLVPRLNVKGYEPADAAFLAGLCTLCLRVGWRDITRESLAGHLRLVEQAVEQGKASPVHLAPLVRLWVELHHDAGEDPVPLVVRKLARCFHGKLSLSFAQELLEDWVADCWTTVNLARLRVMLCDSAFEAGFEVQNLLDASQNAPALGMTLRVESVRRLAALRLLWSMRAERPWSRMGDVRTVFELAEDPALSTPLARYPDLLLWQQDRTRKVVADGATDPLGPLTIQQTLAGVWLQDVLFIAPPGVLAIRQKLMASEMQVGADVFRSDSDLEPVARLLERWFRWAFQEFGPKVDQVLTWRSPDRQAILRSWGAIPCLECGRYFLPRVGELGIALDELSA